MLLTVRYIHLFLKIHPIGKGQSLQSNHWSFSNRLWLFAQFSVKLFMKHIFFSFVFIILKDVSKKIVDKAAKKN